MHVCMYVCVHVCVHVCVCVFHVCMRVCMQVSRVCVCVCDQSSSWIQKEELVQARDRELAQAQQRLREKVNSVNYIMFHVL